MESIKKLKERVLDLNKLEVFKCRDTKLPFMKRMGYRIFGWCSDTVAESLWESNQMLSVILDELISQYELLLTEVKKVELECEEIRKDEKISVNEREQLKAHTEASEKLINDLLVQVKDIQERENWTRERFEGQDKRLESGEVFQDWARERFDGQDKRLESGEVFQDWARNRFDGHDERFAGIEERETWTRERFNEAFDRLWRLDEITNYSVKKEMLKVPVIDKDDIVMSRIMLNNRMFWMAAYKNAQDDISEAVKEGRLSCGNSELLHVFDKPGTFLDLGANIGAFSLGFASQGWKGIAFEAGSKNYELLKQSIDENGFEIQLFNKAVHSVTGVLCFNEEGPWGRVVTDDKQTLNGDCIEALALDDFIKDAKNITESIDLVKIDIEGSEVAAIRGMSDFLRSYGFPAVYAECNAYALSLQGESPLSLYETMKELGYQPYCYEYGNIYSFDVNEFQMEYCVDRLFIHSDHISEFKTEKKTPVEEKEIKDNIVNHLKELLKEDTDSEGRVSAHHNYVCSLLKHYPELYAEEEIGGMLKYVLNTRTKDTYLMNALAWFKNMER